MNPEDTLRKLFEELKRHDAAEAPLFHQCLPRDQKPIRRRPVIRIFLLATAAAAVLVAAGASFFLPTRPAPSEASFEEWAALSNWQPSSDQIVAQNPALPGNQLSAPSDSLFENSTSTATSQQKL